MIRIRKSLISAVFCCTLLFLASGVAAFTVGYPSVSPSGNLFPGNTVNVSWTVYAASGTAFPSYDDLQFITELDDPRWTYAILVNGVENSRPVVGGKMLTINGFELGYEDKDEVIVEVVLRGTVPAGTAQGSNKTLVKIQELDARGHAIPYSIVNIDHLIGEPTPAPTPAYGSIAITSVPAGADIFIDNVYKGLSPAVFDTIPNGRHVVLVKLEGYQDSTRSVTVMADNQSIQAALERERATTATPQPGQTQASGSWTAAPSSTGRVPGYGSLSITTSPPGALVYVDGTMMGVTPTTIPMLTEGPHSITLMMDGYQDLKTSIVINDGTTSEYVTGLSKAAKTPGFAAGIAVVSTVLLFLFRKK